MSCFVRCKQAPTTAKKADLGMLMAHDLKQNCLCCCGSTSEMWIFIHMIAELLRMFCPGAISSTLATP